jgi:cell division protein FtsQ
MSAPRPWLWMDLAAAFALAAAAMVLLGGGALWLAQRPAFGLKRIEVQGELRHVSQASVRAAVAGRLRGGYFTLSLDETRRVFESVPWVASASLRRVWPDALAVVLAEHRALGVWSDGRLLSTSGVLFTANPAEAEVYGPLVEVSGPPRFAAEVARRHAELAGHFAPLGLQIAAIDVSERGSWSVRTTTAQRIELGRDEPVGRVSDRIGRIAAGYPYVVARLGVAPTRIDARYPTGFAAAPYAPAARNGGAPPRTRP